MGRIYTSSFREGTIPITAAISLFSVGTGTSSAYLQMAVSIHQITLNQRGLTTWEARPISFNRRTGAYTAASGGAAATPTLNNPGDVAATATCRALDTTVASGGTNTVIGGDDWVFLNGFFWLPAPEDRIILAPGQLFELILSTGPSAAITLNASGSITFEELT